MAVYKDEDMFQLFAPQLQPGEQLVHWAYGVKQPPILVIILLVATIGGALAVHFLTKHYVVALTSHGRFVVLQMSGKTVKASHWYQLGQLSGVKTSAGAIFTHIKIDGPVPFKAKFHRMGMKQNRDHSRAMAAALEGKQLGA
jgi:CO/xanthine dehydrogenase FAD-binding subunit